VCSTRLLEVGDLEIEGISGTSAGAMNAAVLASGYIAGGAAGAKATLEEFWRRVAWAAQFSPFRRTPLDIMLGRWTLDTSPAFIAYDLTSRLISSYALNPRGTNPLRDILAESIDFTQLATAPIRLFVTATNVRTGCGRVFANGELTPDVLLASACPPMLFQAIEIDNEAYWDGGYSGNPTITPLVRAYTSSDTILVQVNPVERPGTPRSAREIFDRLNEVSFNAPLLKELRMIAVLRQVSNPGDCDGARWVGGHAHPPHREPADAGPRLLIQAQRRVGFSHDAARRGAPLRGSVSHGARKRYRTPLDARPRCPTRCGSGDGACEGAIDACGAKGTIALQGDQERFKRDAAKSLGHT
jgi:NTE family protein